MLSMSELRAYKATQHHLDLRLIELRRLESKAHRARAEGGTLDKWTDAIRRSNETAQAIYHLDRIVAELEGS